MEILNVNGNKVTDKQKIVNFFNSHYVDSNIETTFRLENRFS